MTYSTFARSLLLNVPAIHGGGLCVPKKMLGLVDNMFAVPERVELKLIAATTKSIVVPVTGGLDSTVLYQMALQQAGTKNVYSAYVALNHAYRAKELVALYRLRIKPTYVFDETGLPLTFWKHIIPGRNFLILSLIADKSIEDTEIWFGVVDGEFPLYGGDKSDAFIRQVNAMFSALPNRVQVLTPISHRTKGDLVRWWLEHNLSLEQLEATVSCFNGGSVPHCGRCQACLRKWLAFDYNGLVLKTETPVQEGCVEYIDKYRALMRKALETGDFSKYSRARCEQDMKGLEKL